MTLDPPIPLLLKPMEAEPVDDLPRGKGWLYEPNMDGFRCLAFRDLDKIDLTKSSARDTLGDLVQNAALRIVGIVPDLRCGSFAYFIPVLVGQMAKARAGRPDSPSLVSSIQREVEPSEKVPRASR